MLPANIAAEPAQIGEETSGRSRLAIAASEESNQYSQPLPAESLDPDSLSPDSLSPRQGMLGEMAGRSLVMQHLFARMNSTAPHFRLASVEGEPGTGKLLAARTLHRLGPGASGPFAPWLAADFLHDPSACWSQARGGLLWLSRVDELTLDQQRQLRDFLERAAHERIRRGHGFGPLQALAGACQPFRQLAAAGSFRPDLAHHLTVIRFVLPPLRERREDIPLLAALFLSRWIRSSGRLLRGFGPGAIARLTAYDWPGNVRELESAVAAAAVDCPGQWIRPIDFPPLEWPAPGLAGPRSFPPAARQNFHSSQQQDSALDDPDLDRAIFRHVTRVLARVNGNKVRAAKLLGISRSTLYRLLENQGFHER